MTDIREAKYFTAADISQRGLQGLPDELVSSRHLIYSSPATLAFNSPGAEGFGVKRAGLAIPGSVMLLVAPGCCGRNTSLISSMPEYNDRFFYLNMNETDVVTGRHLRKIPQAVCEVVDSLDDKPSVVMICITCVDALLGTDMERVCRKAEEKAGLPVRPCYMYALTREGRKPPMIHVRQSLYSMLEPMKKRGTSVNLLGFFAPVCDNYELKDYLRGIGVRQIRQISTSADFNDFLCMAEANFNIVLHPEARLAAKDLEERLGIPSIELTRMYRIDRIRSQYAALGNVLGVKFDDAAGYSEAEQAIEDFKSISSKYIEERRGFSDTETVHKKLRIAVGECMNGDPFELALALTEYGCEVTEIFGTLQGENFRYLEKLAEISPDTRIYSNMEPTMLYYDSADTPADVTVGKDAGYYHPECPCVQWNSDVQPYGYAGLRHLMRSLAEVLK